MKTLRFLIFAAILAACAPVAAPAEIATPTAPSLGAMNAEAGATLAAAAGQATQSAARVMAATEQAAATQSAYAFAVTGTAQALDAARAQSAATATAWAVGLEQAQAAGAATLAAQGTQTAATATSAFIGLQIEQAQAEAARAERSTSFYRAIWGMFFIVLLAAVMIFLWQWGGAVVDVWQKRGAVFDNGMALLIHDGEQWAPAGEQAPRLLPSPDPSERDPSAASQWATAICRFAFFGKDYDFSLRRMVSAGMVTDHAWREFTALMAAAGVLVKDKSGTTWAEGWDYRRFAASVRNGLIALPFPDFPPPDVNIPRPPHTPQAHNTATQVQVTG